MSSRIIRAQQVDRSRLRPWKPAAPAPLKDPPSPAAGATFGEMAAAAGDLAESQAKAVQQIAAAQSEAGQIKVTAREEGLVEGRSLAQQELEAKRTEVARLVEEIETERANFFDRMEPEVARLSVTIAEKVIARELETRPETVIDLVRTAMKRMRERESLRVRVNPEDISLVRAARDELMAEVDGVKKLDLIDDRRVGQGGCVIESSNGILDSRIKTQLEEIERVISEAATHGAPSRAE